MSEDVIFWLCIVASGLGCAAIAAVVLFGWLLFRRQCGIDAMFSDLMNSCSPSPHLTFHDCANSIGQDLENLRQRRNEYWTIYGQIVLSTLVVIALTVLLLTKTISPEAGLPILSGISGFAIAKTIGSTNRRDTGPRG